MALDNFSFVFVLLVFVSYPSQVICNNQTQFFNLLKSSLSGSALSGWDVSGGTPYCNFTGVSCNDRGYVEKLDMAGWSISGDFPADICTYLPELRVLDLSRNNQLGGDFIYSIANCSLLEEFNMSCVFLRGKFPDLSNMKSLRILDVSHNHFTGDFPMSITNLTNLEVLYFNMIGEINLWQMPENITGLTKLRVMIFTTCKLYGRIPPFIGNMTSLVDLELAGNFFTGQIPAELGKLKNLKWLELYYNQQLSGPIPEELGNLTNLEDLDMSVNKLTGNIPESICRLPKLKVLQLYNNSLTGEIPSAIADSTTLTTLSLYDNFLTGQVPKNLGRLSPMVMLDVSENRLSGPLPADICRGGKLMYFLVLENMFSGQIPENYADCKMLSRFRVSKNHLEGKIPEGLLGLPHASIIDLGSNSLTGPFPNSTGNARNLSELFIQNNMISGVIPPEISQATNLVKIDLSNNLLSGPIPSGIGYLRNLNILQLQSNKLSSSIPDSLSLLKSLNLLDLSNNLLTGHIPESLGQLSQTSITFSNNKLSGPIPLPLIKGGLLESFSGNPGLCVPVYIRNFPLCSQINNQKNISYIWAVGLVAVITIAALILCLKHFCNKDRAAIEHDETMSSSFFSYELKSFHKTGFDQREIFDSLVDKNIIGHGGSGTVYKIGVSSGDVVAVKKLWSAKTKDSAPEDGLFWDKGLKTEVETLGNIRHKNIVKLYSYLSSFDCSLLVYEFMPNGNLWDALHKGFVSLDWPTRHQIALGVAQGLAYLHHDLLPPIIHRDIKTTNILLDVNCHPKVADFGVAKVLQATGGKDFTTTVVAGTYGYMAPEYSTSNKATTRCDVYSFGVVLMELITGKKPVEAEFGESKNIVYWVSTKVDTQEGVMEVLDKHLSGSFRDEMIWVLRIAIRCTYKNPTLRPTMKEVVELLNEADPCRFDSCKRSSKNKESSDVTKSKN